jgi:hypothetical protein
MTSQSSPLQQSPDESMEDDSNAISDSLYHTQEDGGDTEHHDDLLSDDTPGAESQHTKQSLPLQKRRRVTRACDECRRKKIKCDGKQPCTHCTVYSYGKRLCESQYFINCVNISGL